MSDIEIATAKKKESNTHSSMSPEESRKVSESLKVAEDVVRKISESIKNSDVMARLRNMGIPADIPLEKLTNLILSGLTDISHMMSMLKKESSMPEKVTKESAQDLVDTVMS